MIEPYHMLITSLIGLLCFAAGVGTAQFTLVRRLNKTNIQLARESERIKSLFNNQDAMWDKTETCLKLHVETLQHVRDVIAQNNILIQKVIVTKG